MIESNIIGKKDAEELAEMFNEEHKKKPVYEDFKFSAKEKDHLLDREEETKRLENFLEHFDLVMGDLNLDTYRVEDVKKINILCKKERKFWMK